jgi:hypothetical protein
LLTEGINMKVDWDYQIVKVSEFGSHHKVIGGLETVFHARDILNILLKDFPDPELRSMYKITYVETTYYDLEEIE